ncbi:MAG: hypothetical protein NTX82_04655 [Candidatus Parcubacteria bacterium]|nr:hypothetical protein [Candidatus Parcubacteria bacterium]
MREKPIQLGFSHGVLYRLMEVYSAEAIRIYHNLSDSAIEICCNKAEDSDKLGTLIPLMRDFQYCSLHLPCHNRYVNDAKTRELLDKLADFYFSINGQLALVHPDLVDDWEVFNDFPFNWAVENMDNRKAVFKVPSDFTEFFSAHPSWKFVLDLNHVFSNDPSMQLAEDFLAQLGHKVAEIHLSGYTGYHEPLFQTRQLEILNYCQIMDVPVIIESAFDQIADIELEYRYILDNCLP